MVKTVVEKKKGIEWNKISHRRIIIKTIHVEETNTVRVSEETEKDKVARELVEKWVCGGKDKGKSSARS